MYTPKTQRVDEIATRWVSKLLGLRKPEAYLTARIRVGAGYILKDLRLQCFRAWEFSLFADPTQKLNRNLFRRFAIQRG